MSEVFNYTCTKCGKASTQKKAFPGKPENFVCFECRKTSETKPQPKPDEKNFELIGTSQEHEILTKIELLVAGLKPERADAILNAAKIRNAQKHNLAKPKKPMPKSVGK
jgi:hypothetical protein